MPAAIHRRANRAASGAIQAGKVFSTLAGSSTMAQR
jgi:hypothetical protein